MTVSLWFTISQCAEDHQCIWGIGEGPWPPNGKCITFEQGNYYGTRFYSIGAGGGDPGESTWMYMPNSFEDGSWHHVVLSMAPGGIATGYWDGEYWDTKDYSSFFTSTAAGSITVGESRHQNYWGYYGSVDDFRVLPYAVDASGAAALYDGTAPVPTYCDSASALIGASNCAAHVVAAICSSGVLSVVVSPSGAFTNGDLTGYISSDSSSTNWAEVLFAGIQAFTVGAELWTSNPEAYRGAGSNTNFRLDINPKASSGAIKAVMLQSK